MADKLAELSARFVARAPAECVAIQSALNGNNYSELLGRAHRLAGISDMVGQPDVGAAARKLETTLDRGDDPAEDARHLLGLLGAL